MLTPLANITVGLQSKYREAGYTGEMAFDLFFDMSSSQHEWAFNKISHNKRSQIIFSCVMVDAPDMTLP